MLNFLVSDILDFALLKQGEFKKKISNFNIIDCINEVISIFKYKSD